MSMDDQNRENRRKENRRKFDRRKNLSTPDWVVKMGDRRKGDRRAVVRREGK